MKCSKLSCPRDVVCFWGSRQTPNKQSKKTLCEKFCSHRVLVARAWVKAAALLVTWWSVALSCCLSSAETCWQRWSLEWVALTVTQPYTVFGCKTCTSVDLLSWHGVSQNERVDTLASTADITSGLQLGRAEVLRGLRNFLNMDRPEHHSIDRLKERGVGKGSGRHPTLQGRERSVFNQTNIGTVSRAVLGRLLRDGRYDAILSWNWNWTEAACILST